MAVFACGKSTVQPMGPTPRLTGAATGTQTGTSCLPTTRNLPVVINVRVGNVVAFFQTRPTPRAPGPQELRTDNFQRSTPKNVQRTPSYPALMWTKPPLWASTPTASFPSKVQCHRCHNHRQQSHRSSQRHPHNSTCSTPVSTSARAKRVHLVAEHDVARRRVSEAATF